MGHERMGILPRTRTWQEVLALIDAGAEAWQVAKATLHAAERTLNLASEDLGLVEAVWLLMQLPEAAQADDFAAALRGCGLDVPSGPNLLDITAALSDAIDRGMRIGRNDLGEFAQTSAVEAVTQVVGERLQSLFPNDSRDVQHAFAALRSPVRMAEILRAFMARVSERVIGYFLSAETALHVGPAQRFLNLAQVSDFNAALRTHCFEAADIIRVFSAEWFSKERHASGHISRDAAAKFVHGAAVKLTSEFTDRATSDAT